MNRRIDTRNLGHPGIGSIPSVREHVEHDDGFIDLRNALTRKVEMTAEERMFAALDPKSAEKMIQERHKESQARLDEVAKAYKGPIMDMRGKVLFRLKASPIATTTAQRIMNGLSVSVRTAKVGVHPYKNAYGVDFNAVEADQEFLRTMMGTYPDIEQELTFLRDGLEELSQQDPSYGIRQFERHREDSNKMNESMNGVGRAGLFLIGAVGFLVLGVPRIFRWKLPGIGSWLFLALALSQFPSVRALFSAKDQLMLKQVDQTTNHPLFRQLCHEYDVKGSSWGAFARRTMNDSTEADALRDRWENNNKSVKGIEREVDAYVARSGLAPKEKAKLQEMIVDGKFPAFIQGLSRVTSSDAQSITQDFIRTGASVYDGKIAGAKRQVNPLNGLSGIR